MTDPEELEPRVHRIENEQVRMRKDIRKAAQDAAAARILAGGADLEVSELSSTLNAHTQSLNALRETQLELRESHIATRSELRTRSDATTQLINALRETQLEMQTTLNRKFDKLHGAQLGMQRNMDSRFSAVDDRLDTVDERLNTVDNRLSTVDQRFDTVDQRFDTVDQRFDTVDQRFDTVDQRFDTVDQRFDTVDDKLTRITELLQVRWGPEAPSGPAATSGPEG